MLRPYQNEAFEAVKRDLERPGASLIVMPTASGKSHVIATAATLVQPVLILQPSRELLSQNREKLAAIVPPDEIGTYSASFGERTIKKFTFATIQSVYQVPHLFTHIKLVILDECHGVTVRDIDAMYTKFLRDIGSPKVIGTTATPYRCELSYFRHEDGELEQCTMLKLINRTRPKYDKDRPETAQIFWKRIIYKIDHKTLLDQGYLSPIEYIHEPLLPYAEIPINVSRSDYNLAAYSKAIVGREALILSTLAEAQKKFKSVLVFCPTTEQAIQLSSVMVGSAVVTALTPKKERTKIIEDFKSGAIKMVFNMGTLTTGFDKPDLDCIVLLRPTRSLPLYNQMLGRITRVSPGKTHGTVIDLTGTCKAMGRMETFELYVNEYRSWDLRTEKHSTWHNRVLFKRMV